MKRKAWYLLLSSLRFWTSSRVAPGGGAGAYSHLGSGRIPSTSTGVRVAVAHFPIDGFRGSWMKRNSGMTLKGAQRSLNVELTRANDEFLVGQPAYRTGLHTDYPRNGHGNQPCGTVVASQRRGGDSYKELRGIHV